MAYRLRIRSIGFVCSLLIAAVSFGAESESKDYQVIFGSINNGGNLSTAADYRIRDAVSFLPDAPSVQESGEYKVTGVVSLQDSEQQTESEEWTLYE